jgi:hypothetical protein
MKKKKIINRKSVILMSEWTAHNCLVSQNLFSFVELPDLAQGFICGVGLGALLAYRELLSILNWF